MYIYFLIAINKKNILLLLKKLFFRKYTLHWEFSPKKIKLNKIASKENITQYPLSLQKYLFLLEVF